MISVHQWDAGQRTACCTLTSVPLVTLVNVQQAVIAQARRCVVYSLGTQWISPRSVVWSRPVFTRDARQKSGRDKRDGLDYRVVSTIAVLFCQITPDRFGLCSRKTTNAP